MDEITIIAFNYGRAGKYVNGPGMCLVNFVTKLQQFGVKVNIFTEQKSEYSGVKTLNDPSIQTVISRSKLLHHWSGITSAYAKLNRWAFDRGIKVLVGPNVLDTVELNREQAFLSVSKCHKFLTVNTRLKFLLSKIHQIPAEVIELLRIGPDENLWQPSGQDNGKILWKGNSKQFVKDIKFGLEVQDRLKHKYDFEFLGFPEPYSYLQHIEAAKNCHLYFTTSLSETMGLAILESFCSGLPAILHPKIYLDLPNYQAGIITSRDLDSYCQAIEEVMENTVLYSFLSQGAQDYIKNNFTLESERFIGRELDVS